VLDVLLAGMSPSGRIQVGNSPLQSCDYSALRQDAEIDKIEARYAQDGEGRVSFHDLRTVKSAWSRGTLKKIWEDDSEETVEVDLGEESYLDELFDGSEQRVRVGDYPPEATSRYHSKGRHIYAINKRILTADLLVSVPKLKTHQKVAVTCALKGCVGTVTRKECLAHHRQGDMRTGGDEYFGTSRWRELASRFADRAATPNTGVFANSVRFGSKVAYRLAGLGNDVYMGGAWFGNDTAWRMTLDLARIAQFADAEGILHKTQQRGHYVVIDGIVGGDGNGPLRPRVVDSRVLIGSNDPFAADIAAAQVMGFPLSPIPIVSRPFTDPRFGVGPFKPESLEFLLNGLEVKTLNHAGRVPFAPSKGWKPVLDARLPGPQS
jgi:Domain of unknown function (DUF362)